MEWKPPFPTRKYPAGPDLGNFLSGMETGLQVLGGRAGDDLGNFLSGMETGILRDRVLGRFPLETSLVEWKQKRLGIQD